MSEYRREEKRKDNRGQTHSTWCGRENGGFDVLEPRERWRRFQQVQDGAQEVHRGKLCSRRGSNSVCSEKID